MTDISELSNQNRRRYFQYLCRQVRIDKPTRNIRKSYEKVAEFLHQEAFYVSNGIENDWNRANDAHQFRRDYIFRHMDVEDDLRGPVSVLEVMVAMANRCENQLMRSLNRHSRKSEWFIIMMDNLGLLDLDDDVEIDHLGEIVGSIVERALMREYDYYGNGGFWACLKPRQDMRDTELWVQMTNYLNERLGYI